MLTTRFNLCQGGLPVRGPDIAELAACAEHVAASTLADEDVDSSLLQDGLKFQHRAVDRSAECAPRKFVERDQVDLVAQAAEQLRESPGILNLVIDPGQQHILKRQYAART